MENWLTSGLAVMALGFSLAAFAVAHRETPAPLPSDVVDKNEVYWQERSVQTCLGAGQPVVDCMKLRTK